MILLKDQWGRQTALVSTFGKRRSHKDVSLLRICRWTADGAQAPPDNLDLDRQQDP